MNRNNTLHHPPPPEKMKALLVFVLTLFAALSVISLLSEGSYSANLSSPGPKNLTVEITGSVILEWDAPANNTETITGYQILRRTPLSGESTLQILVNNTETNETAYTDLNATEPREFYVYRVKAWRNQTLSRWSNYDSVYLPSSFGAPTNLTVNLVDGYVTLNWNAPLGNAQSITGYEILRRKPLSGESTLMTLVNDTEINETSYIDLNATEPSARYVYRVKALRNGEKSRWSNYDYIKLPGNYSAPPTVTFTLINSTIEGIFINNSDVSEDYQLPLNSTIDYNDYNNTIKFLRNINISIEDEELVYMESSDNMPPSFATFETFIYNLNENVNASLEPIVIYTATATDPENDTIMYDMSPVPGFEINETSGVVTYVGEGFDYENLSEREFHLFIKPYDMFTVLHDNSPFVLINIVINNVKEAHEFKQAFYDFNLNENADGSSTTPVFVGNVSSAVPETYNLTYFITEGNTSKFSVNESTGEVYYIGGGEDFENGPAFYDLTIYVSDGSLNSSADVRVEVVDVNEAPEFPRGSYISVSINENINGSSNHIFINDYAATDPENDNLTYFITEGDTSGNTSKFRVDESNGEVFYIGSGEDYEGLLLKLGGAQYLLTITVSDGEYNDSYIFTLEINDVNEAPEFSESSYIFNLSENRDGSTMPISLGFVNATDDDGNSLTFIINEQEVSNTFAINSSTGEITYIGGGEDFENGPAFYELTIYVSDGSLNSSADVRVEVVDVNERPKFSESSYNFSLDENVGGSPMNPVFIGNVTATDEDAGDILRYTIILNETNYQSNHPFRLNELTGKLVYIGSGEDYENKSEYEFQVSVKDNELFIRNVPVRIDINDVNDAPEFSESLYTFNLSENRDGSTMPISLGFVNATDDDGNSLTFIINEQEVSNTFAINSSTGEITYIGGEENYENRISHTVLVNVSDDSLSDSAVVFIRILDVNEAPEFNQGSYNFILNENVNGSSTPFPVGTVTATDPEEDTLTYSITSGNTNNKFDINSTTGEITYIGSGEDGSTPEYLLNISVTDTEFSAQTTVQITINTTVNSNNPPSFVEISRVAVLREDKVGSVFLGAVSANDADNDTLTYSITEGDKSKFRVDTINNVGNLYYIGSGEDYETGPRSYNLTIEASDETDSASLLFTINIRDVNEAPEFNQGSYDFILNENTSGSTTPVPIGTVTATDEDGDTLEYSITSGATNKFNISSENGAITYIGSGEDGSTSEYSLSINVTDTEFSDQTTVQITINTTISIVNPNNPPVFTEISHLSLAENRDGRTTAVYVGNVTATDQDNDTLTYSITEGDINKFNIDSSVGEITYIGSGENYESDPKQYNLTIQVTDNSWNVAGNITVSIADANDAPVFIENSYTFTLNISSTSVSIGTVTATDEDGDTLGYSITSGNADNNFNIDETTGDITYTGSGEDGSTPQYHLNVRVQDNDSASASTDVYINVVNNSDDIIPPQLGLGTYVNICDRTWWVRNKILDLTPSSDACASVDLSELAAITELDFNGYGNAIMKVGDFDDMVGLRRLDLSDLGIGLILDDDGSYLDGVTDNLGGLFRDLTNLEYLSLMNNNLHPHLPDDSFANMGNLRELDMRGYSRNLEGRDGSLTDGNSLGACWSLEEKAQSHPQYPWDARKNSPNAFKPLVSLETYNYEYDFNTENIFSLGEERNIIFSATMISKTRPYSGVLNATGYGSLYPGSSLTQTSFTFKSREYTVKELQLVNGDLELEFNKDLTDRAHFSLVLTIGHREFNFRDSSFTTGNGNRRLTIQNVNFLDSQPVNISIAATEIIDYEYEPEPYATNNYIQPPASPQNIGVSENERVFTITWDAPENEDVTHYRIERGLNSWKHQAMKRTSGLSSSVGSNVQCVDHMSDFYTDFSHFANHVDTVTASQNSYTDDLSGKLPLSYSSIWSLNYHVYAITEDGESMPVTIKAR